MSRSIPPFASGLLKVGAVALILNEIRGLVIAAPVLWGIYKSGGTLVGIGVGLCLLGGIALSVIVPYLVAKRLRRRLTVAE